MKIRRATTRQELVSVRALDRLCFPWDDPYRTQGSCWWLAWDGEDPVAYSGIKWLASEDSWYLCRVGVLAPYRRQGLAKRLTRARTAHAHKTHPGKPIITYCMPWNLASANNLIRSGFTLYEPEDRWGGNAFYFRRD